MTWVSGCYYCGTVGCRYCPPEQPTPQQSRVSPRLAIVTAYVALVVANGDTGAINKLAKALGYRQVMFGDTMRDMLEPAVAELMEMVS